MNKSKTNQTTKETTLTRRSLIKGSAAGVGAAAAALAFPHITNARGGRLMTIRVENAVYTHGPGAALGSLDNFVGVGDITMLDGEPITGKWFCKGVAFVFSVLDGRSPDPDAASYAEQRFRIDGIGSILGAGAEIDGLAPIQDDMAIVGGTGRFVGVHGIYTRVGPGPIPFGDGVLEYEFDIRRG